MERTIVKIIYLSGEPYRYIETVTVLPDGQMHRVARYEEMKGDHSRGTQVNSIENID